MYKARFRHGSVLTRVVLMIWIGRAAGRWTGLLARWRVTMHPPWWANFWFAAHGMGTAVMILYITISARAGRRQGA